MSNGLVLALLGLGAMTAGACFGFLLGGLMANAKRLDREAGREP